MIRNLPIILPTTIWTIVIAKQAAGYQISAGQADTLTDGPVYKDLLTDRSASNVWHILRHVLPQNWLAKHRKVEKASHFADDRWNCKTTDFVFALRQQSSVNTKSGPKASKDRCFVLSHKIQIQSKSKRYVGYSFTFLAFRKSKQNTHTHTHTHFPRNRRLLFSHISVAIIMYGSLGLVRDRRDMLRACHKIKSPVQQPPPSMDVNMFEEEGPRQLATSSSTSSSPLSPSQPTRPSNLTSMLNHYTPFSIWTKEWNEWILRMILNKRIR